MKSKVDIDIIKKHKKFEWKKVVKNKVKWYVNEVEGITKLRFLKHREFRENKYENECKMSEKMTLRLNMIECNYQKTKDLSKVCGREEENTEHMLKCREMKKRIEDSISETT